MNTLLQEAPTENVVPTDFLSEWIRKGTLLSLILDAGQTLDWPEYELELAARSGYAFRRPVMLTVVTYCYANGVYSSRDIASRISRDEILRFLCAGTYPAWDDIRDFTRRNRSLIKQSLIQTYKLAREYGLGTAAGYSGDWEQANLQDTPDRARVDLNLQLAETAEDQIEQTGQPAHWNAVALEN
jgi:hypothetical protein